MDYLAGFINGFSWRWQTLRTCSPKDARHAGFYKRGQGKRWESYKRGFARATGFVYNVY